MTPNSVILVPTKRDRGEIADAKRDADKQLDLFSKQFAGNMQLGRPSPHYLRELTTRTPTGRCITRVGFALTKASSWKFLTSKARSRYRSGPRRSRPNLAKPQV